MSDIGCMKCGELNPEWQWTNEELGLRKCCCSDHGQVISTQEAFDWIVSQTRAKRLKEVDEKTTQWLEEFLEDEELEDSIEELDFNE